MSAPKLGKLVSNDPGFAVQVLQIVNSSLYSRGSKITSVTRAVAVLGSRTLRNIALCAATRNCVKRRALGKFDLPRFWEDSLRRAVAAQMLAESVESETVDPMEVFTAGLLQDLGVLALIQTEPEKAEKWMAVVNQPPHERRAIERREFGKSHDDIAPMLSNAWSLPSELAVPMRYHHTPDESPVEHRQRCQIAAWAELVSAVLSCNDKRDALARARQVLGLEAKLTSTEVDQLIGRAGERVAEAATALGFKVGSQPTLEDVLMAANKGLAEMNLSYEDLVQKLERTIAEKEALARELEERNRTLEQLSVTDTLTGLPNRRAFAGRLNYEITRTARLTDSLTLIIGDVDHFKSVNDTWGHEFGDRVLQTVAVALGDSVRQADLVARIGGEEFAVLLPSTDAAGAAVVAEKLLRAVSSKVNKTPDGESKSFTISLGVATLTGPFNSAFDPDEVGVRLYKASDGALYGAKRGGRNRASVSEEQIGWAPPGRRAA